jgi:hypothetical protein
MKRLSLVLTCLALGCSAGASPSSPSTSPFPPTPLPNSTLTLTASPACASVTDWVSHRPMSFPEEARVRHFVTALTDSSLFVDNSGPSRHPARVANSRSSFRLPRTNWTGVTTPPPGRRRYEHSLRPVRGDLWYHGFGRVGPTGYLENVEVCGTWHARISDPTEISGTIDGPFIYYKGEGPKFETVLYCRATDHQFTLTTREIDSAFQSWHG